MTRRRRAMLVLITLMCAVVSTGAVAGPARAAVQSTVTKVSPAAGPSTGGTTVTLTGTGFLPSSTVRISSVDVSPVTFVSSTQLRFVTPDLSAFGDQVMPVYVITEGGASSGSDSTFTSVQPLTVQSITPARGDPAGGQVLSLYGTGLRTITAVTFGGVQATTVRNQAGRTVDVVTPPGAVGTVPVVVTTRFGRSQVTAQTRFTYTDAPTVSSITPNHASARGGDGVAIVGTHLRRAKAVYFGDVRAASFSVVSDRKIVAILPAAAAGQAPVRVVTSDVGSSRPDADRSYFYFQTVPRLSAVTPAEGPVGGGGTVTLTGEGLALTTKVVIAGVEVPFTVQSGSAVTFTAPPHAAGSFSVYVETIYDSTAADDTVRYTYVDTFAAYALSPQRGPVAGGVTATITGVGLSRVTSVRFGSVAAPSFRADSDTQLTVTTPPHSPGITDVYLSDGTTTIGGPYHIFVGDTLYPGDSLSPGSNLESPDGNWHAMMLASGEFIVSAMNSPKSWSTGTSVSGSTVRLQADGNLVVYAPSGSAQWSSGSAPAAAGRLVMQNDGNLVMYSRGGLAIWSSNTGRLSAADVLGTGQQLASGRELWSTDGRFRAAMQGDGNFVLYRNSDNAALWNSGTAGNPGATVVMQGDGNLVVYRTNGQAAWSSSTAPTSGGRLVMQGDGNLVLYNGSNQAVWSNGTVLGGGGGSNATAVTWAKAHLGQVYGTAAEQPAGAHQWSGYCWTFVFDAYGGKVPRQPTAQAGFDYYNARGMIRGGQPPAGAIAFYSYQSDGHAAVVVEGGQIIGTRGSSTDRYAVYQTAYNARGLPFLGWAMP